MKCSLLSLPTELRHAILEYIVNAPIEPPQNCSAKSTCAEDPKFTHEPIIFNKAWPHTNLLLVSKSFTEDVQRVLQRPSNNPVLHLLLDSSINQTDVSPNTDNWLIVATWLLPPRFINPMIPCLEVRIRSQEGIYATIRESGDPDVSDELADCIPRTIECAIRQDPGHFGRIVSEKTHIQVLKLHFDHQDHSTLHVKHDVDASGDINGLFWTNILGVFEYLAQEDRQREHLALFVDTVELLVNEDLVFSFDLTDKSGEKNVTFDENFLNLNGFKVQRDEHSIEVTVSTGR